MAKAKKRKMTIEDALVPVEEQPYEIPENWCWTYLLTGAAKCKDGFRKPINSSERAEREGDIPYYGATGQVGWIDDYLTDEQLVLLGEDGAPFLDLMKDKAYMIEGKAWVNNHAHILQSYYGEIGNKYLLHYLNTFNYHGFVNGTTRLKLTQASMNTMPVPLPPLAEQKRIVEQIENLFAKLDEAKDKSQEALDSFDSRKNAILYKSLSGDYTRTWRVKNNISLEDWNEYTIEEICVNIVDCPHTTPEWTEEGVLCLRTTNIKLGYFDFSEIQYVDADTYRERTERLVPKEGDLVFTREGSVGDVALVPANTKLCLGQRMMLMRTSEKCLPEYLLYFLISPFIRNYIKENIMGTTAPRMNIKDIKKLKIQVPPVEEQAEIIKIIKPLLQCDADAKELADTRQNIDMIKKSILAKAFRGELGTNDSSEESSIELLKAIMKE